MIILTAEETRLLQELDEGGEKTTSDNNDRHGLKRLIDAKYVTEAASGLRVTLYKITGAGRAALCATQIQ